MAQADVVSALMVLLKADAAIAALVGVRVFGAELPGDEAAAMPRAAVVLSPSGGVSQASGSYMAHDTQRIDLICFGPTPLEACRLLWACSVVLRGIKRQVVDDCLIHWVQSAGGSFSRRDPDGDWPFAFQPFQIFHALEVAA